MHEAAKALDEVRAVFGDGVRFDDGKLRLIERRAGLKDLRFATDPSATADRERVKLRIRESSRPSRSRTAPALSTARLRRWMPSKAGGNAPDCPS